MAGFLPLAFATPWLLGALLLLPAIWWLLRLTPPRPQEIDFPPTRLLLDIDKHEETPQRSPWWLTLLRLTLAALLILALAGPIWRPAEEVASGEGTMWMLMDNGWTSARDWTTQVETAERLLSLAEAAGQPVLFAATADGPGQPLTPTDATTALERLRALEPRAWASKRSELTTALRKSASTVRPGAVVWLSDGTQSSEGASFQTDLANIAGGAPVTIYSGIETPFALKAISNDADALTVSVLRHPDSDRNAVTVRALDLRGLVLGQTDVSFDTDSHLAEARFEMPSELRNDIARVEVAGENAAGAVQLVDDSWRRRSVGLLSGQSGDLAQPLLSPLYYLQRALGPFSDIRLSRNGDLGVAVPELLDQGLSVLVLADVGRLPDSAVAALSDWIEGGGMLVRFAGPRTAGGTDELIPVSLRAGDRSLGGSLSWKQPQKLADFSASSPFAGLKVPPEVTVNRQVLADPTADLPDRTWAMLEDGTPLVTADRLGRGTIVLFHVTADSAWSNLPLSGIFLDMLRRILAVSNTAEPTSQGTDAETGAVTQSILPPLRLLDGYGRFGSPAADVPPMTDLAFREASAGRKSPPGLYGNDDGFRALNLMRPDDELEQLDFSPLEDIATLQPYPTNDTLDLRAAFFAMAFGLLLLDAIAVILLAGGLSRLRMRQVAAGAAVILILGSVLHVPHAQAQSNSDDLRALEASQETHLAYVLTGTPDVDDTSAAGLFGLSQFLAERTALEPGAPMGVDIARDELAFFSLLYWPIEPTADKPDDRTMARIDTFMRNGGTILFDTRDHISAATTGFGTTPATLKLREILEDLDIPPLEPVPIDHVLTKAFYILDTFPGRYATSPLWVESLEQRVATSERPVRAGDGVSPVMITANDFAAAWAIDSTGSFLFPTIPDDPVQRDYAFRAGVNMVMYSLTGNYKADQVHIPALLERLGQ
ncbi:DUF4159 domain-containing protein [Roseibium polysiphoniae]|uniref:DUF4159 domain-containing protein n=1 Tax=Roseibium polysiphoniae TaxID=2571221 RepID=A0A944CEN3_9HYPH|nr:DUF4159 domain-containing protein [Roseibium polysiphoniae]MBS8260568.1 DUF4159 domain-containing protein [Roseibium polysiphoniae]